MFPLLNAFASARPRQMIVDIEAKGREIPVDHMQRVFAVNHVVFEPREVSQGDEATVRYLTTLAPTDSLEELSNQLMDGGKAGIKNVSWSPPKRELTASARTASSSSPRPAGRRCSMIIAGARERLVLSLFRCNDFGVLDALAAALERGVKVEAILTKRAKGGKKRLRKLWEALEEMGAVVHRYGDPVVKYHAKYLVADGQIGARRDAQPDQEVLHAHAGRRADDAKNARVVRSLSTLFALDAAGERVLPRHRISPRLIVGPEGARASACARCSPARATAFASSITSCRIPISSRCCASGATRASSCRWSGRQPIGPLVPHGKLMIIDETQRASWAAWRCRRSASTSAARCRS